MSETEEQYECIKCEEMAPEVCGDGYCRKCHVSLSFEDCASGEWARRMRRELNGVID